MSFSIILSLPTFIGFLSLLFVFWFVSINLCISVDKLLNVCLSVDKLLYGKIKMCLPLFFLISFSKYVPYCFKDLKILVKFPRDLHKQKCYASYSQGTELFACLIDKSLLGLFILWLEFSRAISRIGKPKQNLHIENEYICLTTLHTGFRSSAKNINIADKSGTGEKSKLWALRSGNNM